MRRGGVPALVLCLLAAPVPAAANSLTIEIWPSDDPTQTISCAMILMDGRFSAVEVKGRGLPPLRPLQWFPSDIEVAAMNRALQTLISGDLRPEVMQTSRTPAPPYISATWVANLDDRIVGGLYLHPGLALPNTLADAISQLLPGGLCHTSLHL